MPSVSANQLSNIISKPEVIVFDRSIRSRYLEELPTDSQSDKCNNYFYWWDGQIVIKNNGQGWMVVGDSYCLLIATHILFSLHWHIITSTVQYLLLNSRKSSMLKTAYWLAKCWIVQIRLDVDYSFMKFTSDRVKMNSSQPAPIEQFPIECQK